MAVLGASPEDGAVEAEKIRLLEVDLLQTGEFIKGVLGICAALRGSAITVWLALLGFAVQQDIAMLSLLAAIIAAVFWIVDGYHGWLYGRAFDRALQIEDVVSSYYADISRRRDSPQAHDRFVGKLRTFRYGLYGSIKSEFSVKAIIESARPRIIYRFLYGFLVAVALAMSLAGFSGLKFKPPASGPTRVVVEMAPPAPQGLQSAVPGTPTSPKERLLSLGAR